MTPQHPPAGAARGESLPAFGWRDDDVLAHDGFNSRVSALSPVTIHRALRRPLTSRLVIGSLGFGRDHAFDRSTGTEVLIVHICVAGEGWVRVDGATHPVRPGDAMVIAPGAPNAYGPRSGPWSSWWFVALGRDIAEFTDAIGASRRRPVIHVADPERIVALVEQVMAVYEHDQAHARVLQATGLAWRLLTQLAVASLSPVPGDPLARAMEHLVDRLESEVRVRDLAALVGLSSSRLTTLFRESTGGGVHAYQIGLRMEKARWLLGSTRLSVAEVARKVGYRDPNYFSRHFTLVHEVSPRDYRRTLSE